MPIDPTGYDKALASIVPGALSERQQRIATVIAMVRDGHTLSHAAESCQIPLSTAWRYCRGLSKLEDDPSNGYPAETQALNDASYDVALIAAEKTRDSLINQPEDWKPSDLIKAYGVATDRVLAFQGRGAAPPNGMTALAEMLATSRVTIEPAGEGSRALEVEGERIG